MITTTAMTMITGITTTMITSIIMIMVTIMTTITTMTIIMTTIKGKGVSFMENNAGWHGKAPNAEQYEQAHAELSAAIEKLEVE